MNNRLTGGETMLTHWVELNYMKLLLKHYRKQAGLTQNRLCEEINISWKYYQRLENGTRLPSLLMLEKIAAALKVKVSDLIDG
ncbi:MAG: helix-turn-helix transcriptional regulator [Candidatus Margulisbacteria bacterium]|nr:helix-turn-helix transcriptional regulator [Candidatus Margulisiibacteriota bacterium]